MILTIALYLISTLIAFAMIARKIWQLRSGRIVEGSYEEADWTDLSIESIRMRLREITRFAVHHCMLILLKIWIVISNWLRRTDRTIHDKFTHFLHKNGHLPAGGKPSRFIKHMRAHKEEVAIAIQKESGEMEA